MKRAYFVCLFLCLTTIFLLSQPNPVPLINQSAGVVPPISASQADPKAQAGILDSYGKLPLSFEANHGQADARVKFLSRTGGYSLFLTGDEAVLTLSGGKANTHEAKIAGTARTLQSGMAAPKSGSVLRMKLRNANPSAKITGTDELAGTSNYFIGNDPKKWRTNVPTYAKVKYEGIYSGIDLVYYGNQRQLEYDFIVAPGADPHRIAFDVSGAKRIRQDAGDLVFKIGEGEIRWHKPVAYQEKNGTRQEIAAHYAITDTRVAFELAKYDASRPLYIDPLIYSTYLGGKEEQDGFGIAVDGAGNAYVTGDTFFKTFPTKNPLQPAYGGGYSDAFVAKINAAGSALVYSTYLGGIGDDRGFGIAVDTVGSAYVTGLTASANFPTKNPIQYPHGGLAYDAFVTKISPDGSALVYSTALGGDGNDQGKAIAVDGTGNAYVTGVARDGFPTTPGAFQTTWGGGNGDAFVAEINPTGMALVYSTYLGGSGYDAGFGIAVDSAGYANITGFTSSDFPTKNPLQPNFGGGSYDAFVARINPAGSALAYSTYLGGNSDDYGFGIAVDSGGNAYVTGVTASTDFPTMNPLQPASGGGTDAFVTKITPSGSLVYSTYLGGSSNDAGTGIAVDSLGTAHVTGYTYSLDFPTLNPLQARLGGRDDAFLAKLNPSGSALLYSTYLGGSSFESGRSVTLGGGGVALDSADNAYITGSTSSKNFPTMNPLQPASGGGIDAFVAKLYIAPGTTTTLVSSLNPSTYGQAVTFTATVTSGVGAPPDGEAVTFMNGTTVLGTETLNGGLASFTTSALPAGVNSITAVYGGDANFGGSTSNVVKQVMKKATTSTMLSSSPNPSTYGQAVIFTAVVTSSLGAPPDGGTVTFKKGTTVLGTGTLSGGSASFTTSALPAGTNYIKAVYSGGSNFGGSTSKAVRQVVN
jgi:hypothetical protein